MHTSNNGFGHRSFTSAVVITDRPIKLEKEVKDEGERPEKERATRWVGLEESDREVEMEKVNKT